MTENINQFEQAIIMTAQNEASQLLSETENKAASLLKEAEKESHTEANLIIHHAERKAELLRSQAAAKARLAAQMLKLRRREELLEQAFNAAHDQLKTVASWPYYAQITRRLIHESIIHLGSPPELLIHADTATQRILTSEVLADLSQEFNIKLHIGDTLTEHVGVVLQTPDKHRRYDNTLQARLTRMKNTLRSDVYHILVGEV